MESKSLKHFSLALLTVVLFSCNHTPLLDKTEKAWLKKHPDLVVGISPNAPPYEFVNDKGEICGIFIDFLTLIESRLDYKFKRVYESDFSKMLSDTRNGTIDVMWIFRPN